MWQLSENSEHLLLVSKMLLLSLDALFILQANGSTWVVSFHILHMVICKLTLSSKILFFIRFSFLFWHIVPSAQSLKFDNYYNWHSRRIFLFVLYYIIQKYINSLNVILTLAKHINRILNFIEKGIGGGGTSIRFLSFQLATHTQLW